MPPVTSISVEGCEVAPLAFDDGRIAALLNACQDYFVQHHGIEPGPQALQGLVADLSPEKRARDLMLFGITTPEGGLIGVLILIRDWDRRRQWCLRNLMLVPERRGDGLGGAIYARVSAWAKSQGAAAMLVGVLAANEGAVRFWQRQGFQEIRRQHFPELGDAMDLEHRFVAARIGDVTRLGGALQRQIQATGSLRPGAPPPGAAGPAWGAMGP
jgi:GNAT superfamily N-acetyltransferase